MKIQLVSHTIDPERQIELAYLSCRNEDPWNPSRSISRSRRIDAMWKSGHISPFEFADATFFISGVSRSCTHQLVRHRLASYEQLSQRSTNPTSFVVPLDLPTYGIETMYSAFNAYNKLIEDGVKAEDARFVLPIGTITNIMVKMNFRSWLHFLRLRLDSGAQWEIREVATQIYEHLKTIAPDVFSEEHREHWTQI